MSFPIRAIRTVPIAEGMRNFVAQGDVQYLEYCPGNGNCYPLVIVRFPELIRVKSLWGPGFLVVLETNQQALFIAEGTFVHWTLVKDKLDLPIAGAVAVAEFLGVHLLLPHVTAEEFAQQQTELEDGQQEDPQEDPA